jgi:hypothetical protein
MEMHDFSWSKFWFWILRLMKRTLQEGVQKGSISPEVCWVSSEQVLSFLMQWGGLGVTLISKVSIVGLAMIFMQKNGA